MADDPSKEFDEILEDIGISSRKTGSEDQRLCNTNEDTRDTESVADEEVRRAHEIITNLDRTAFLSFFSDFCNLRGWATSLTVDDTETVGDLIISQTVPFPQDVAVVYHEGNLTDVVMEEYVNKFGEGDKSGLTIICRSRPQTEALHWAESDRIGIIGIGNVAEAVVLMDGLDRLAELTDCA